MLACVNILKRCFKRTSSLL